VSPRPLISFQPEPRRRAQTRARTTTVRRRRRAGSHSEAAHLSFFARLLPSLAASLPFQFIALMRKHVAMCDEDLALVFKEIDAKSTGRISRGQLHTYLTETRRAEFALQAKVGQRARRRLTGGVVRQTPTEYTRL